MFSNKEREYLENPEDFIKQYGKNYPYKIMNGIRTKFGLAIEDLCLLLRYLDKEEYREGKVGRPQKRMTFYYGFNALEDLRNGLELDKGKGRREYIQSSEEYLKCMVHTLLKGTKMESTLYTEEPKSEFSPQSTPITITDDNYKEMISTHPNFVITTTSPGCGGCKAMKEGYYLLAKYLKGKVWFGIYDTILNHDTDLVFAEEYKAMANPTTLFYKNGKIIKDRQRGGFKGTHQIILDILLKNNMITKTEKDNCKKEIVHELGFEIL